MPAVNASAMDRQIEELISLQGIRKRAKKVLDAARAQQLTNFTFDESRMPEVEEYVAGIMTRECGPDRYDQLPHHSRMQHFSAGNRDRLRPFLDQWNYQGCDARETTRRIVDLLFVSVLLDAGAGDVWRYAEPETGQTFVRSEGIAVASIRMFASGMFQSRNDIINSVDAKGLQRLDIATMNECFQISEQNMMTGFKSRVVLLNKLGMSLLSRPDIFGADGRPGRLVDYLLENSPNPQNLDYALLWETLQQTLLPIWPENRTHINGRCLGDAWPLQVLERKATVEESREPGYNIQPFHKLTQWLGYSLMTPFSLYLNVTWMNQELGTGLAEYRHGGTFIDIPVLQLKSDILREGQRRSGQSMPQFDVTSDVIVEWRAMSIALLDELHERLKAKFENGKASLGMGQMLEAGTFKAGRELAAKYRPETKSSPILISGADGTLF